MTSRRSTWRDSYKVHPFADHFPMMDDLELDALGKDIVANGLKNPIIYTNKGTPEFERFLIDGRNRMEAMERVGYQLDLSKNKKFIDGDAVAAIMSFNVHRRHLSKQERADAIVAWIATMEAENKPGQAGPVSEAKGGRGKRSPVKEKALAINAGLPKEQQVSERTIKRSIAKAEGRAPQPSRYTPRPMPKPRSGKPTIGLEAARRCYLDLCAGPDVDLDAEQEIIIDALHEIAGKRVTAEDDLGNIPAGLDRRRQP